ncbi:KCNH2 [Symbiodinium natans]|uniref:KCNH2 protein n=1 Tax=Symbiodinium natans TaxID=878477 RepID=A0A812TAR3_9DINO|nr:KCNH2 [Symbiodinium natans]
MDSAWRPHPRQWVLWILAAVVPSSGQDTTTTTTTGLTHLYSPDVLGQCVTLKSCQLQGDFPNRGFCISTQATSPDVEGPGEACYDVCNPSHKPMDYTVNGNGAADLSNHISQAMVAQVRAGLNNNVSCPEALGLADSMQKCPPGEQCSDELRHKFKVPSGQGLCVVSGGSESGQACFDMCDYRNPPSRFAEGAHQGIALHVMEFRNSGACQAKPWLPWVIALIVLLLLGACCGLILYSYRRRGGNRRAEMLKDDLGDDEEDQEMPPFEDLPPQGQPGYHEDPGYSPEYDVPARAGAGMAGAGMAGAGMSYEAPPPDPPMMRAEMPDRLGSTGASFKIPGLDEPHLPMPNLNLQLPQSGQSGPIPLQTSASALSTSGQYLPSTAYRAAPASPQAAFTTQLPSYPSPGPAVTSPGSRVYTTTLPAQFAPSGSVHIAPSAPVVTVPPQYTASYSLPPGQQ